jgi:hypothetical protein
MQPSRENQLRRATSDTEADVARVRANQAKLVTNLRKTLARFHEATGKVLRGTAIMMHVGIGEEDEFAPLGIAAR